jgi:uncharacterized protein (TIGR04255 family)
MRERSCEESDRMRRHYKEPPIVEALAEIFFTGSREAASIKDAFYARIQDRFPTQKQLDQVGVEVRVAPGQAAAQFEQRAPRFQFLTEDGTRMIQLEQDLLVVNQLHPNPQVPYPHFEEWQPIVIEMLDLYRELAQPNSVDRLGVRYINRVVIPHTRFQMEQYFTLYPQVPDELGGEHGSFLMRLEIPAFYDDHRLFITFGSAPPDPGQEDKAAYLLDIYDVVPMGEPDSLKTVGRRLDEAHGSIISTFENSITPTARKLFGELENEPA